MNEDKEALQDREELGPDRLLSRRDRSTTCDPNLDAELDEVIDLSNDTVREGDHQLGGERLNQPILVQLFRIMIYHNRAQHLSQQQIQK